MRRIGRVVAGPIAAALILAGVVLGLAPSRAVSVPPLPSVGLPSLLPTLPPLSPLPTIDLGSPLPTSTLPALSPLPSVGLPSPLPTLPPLSPLPTVNVGTPRPSLSVLVSPAASSVAPDPEPTPTLDAGDPGGANGAPGGLGGGNVPPADGADEGLGRPAIVELAPPVAAVPDVGTLLIPAIGVAAPVLVAVAILTLQVLGGAAGVRLARRTLERFASVPPRWTRT